jgi:murein DD-endopeptidase MepM/ murein hydrolase activator NlpD
MTTLYDDKVALWHWRGTNLSEKTIEDAVRTIRRWAPFVKQVWVKTSDGNNWMGRWDDTALAITGVESIQRWVQVLEAHGMEFHAWCVPKGIQIESEADLIIQTCNIAGVRSMILDVEPHPGFWEGGRAAIRPFMTRVRRGVGGRFHLGMSMDPRRHWYNAIFPEDWKSFINSVHPQVYWSSFQLPVKQTIDEVYAVWGNYGRPIIPVLQGYVDPAEMEEARDYVIQKYGAKSISWWRFGVAGPTHYPIINRPIVSVPKPDPDEPIGGYYGAEIVVTPQDPRFAIGTHTGQPVDEVFRQFRGTWGWQVRYKSTAVSQSSVWALWDPQLTESGWYEVSIFVPARHANTTSARYKLHGVVGKEREIQLVINQNQYQNLWVSLGIYQFDANNPKAGVLFLNDLTGETDKTIAFDAVRYRQILGHIPTALYVADGYDAPIGTVSERRGEAVWPGHWFDATGYAVRYFIGTPSEAFHTGADLNLNRPYIDADANSPVYAVASGVVTFADRLTGWGNVIIIRHDPLVTSGQVLYGRYAHIEKMRIKVGDRVQRGQQIANVGNAEGLFPYHLHFDLSATTVLENRPWDWPKLDLNRLRQDYIDPLAFIKQNRPKASE